MLKEVLKDAMKVDELVNQLQEVDHECGFHDGSFEGMLGYYTKNIIIAEAKNRLDMANENLEDIFGYEEGDVEYKTIMREKRQLEKFINKWR
tara:strand:+ start:9094 stop:9369 length:276 start_codon:yes stop_codon:yes gene_type:complete